jgi:hypothetical protein
MIYIEILLSIIAFLLEFGLAIKRRIRNLPLFGMGGCGRLLRKGLDVLLIGI